jgi:cell division protein FtsL
MINLLPLDTRIERQYGRKNRVLIGYVIALLTTALLVAIVMLGSLQFFGTDQSALKNEIEENNSTITALQAKTANLNQTVARLDTVNKLYDSGISFSELVPKIGSLLPGGTVLNALSLTGESTDTLNLDVDLERPELAAVLAKNLVDSELFEAADIGTISPKGGEEDRYKYGTTIRVSFVGSAEAKRKAEAAAAAEAARKAEEAAEASKTQ